MNANSNGRSAANRRKRLPARTVAPGHSKPPKEPLLYYTRAAKTCQVRRPSGKHKRGDRNTTPAAVHPGLDTVTTAKSTGPRQTGCPYFRWFNGEFARNHARCWSFYSARRERETRSGAVANPQRATRARCFLRALRRRAVRAAARALGMRPRALIRIVTHDNDGRPIPACLLRRIYTEIHALGGQRAGSISNAAGWDEEPLGRIRHEPHVAFVISDAQVDAIEETVFRWARWAGQDAVLVEETYAVPVLVRPRGSEPT